jgi:glutamine amidotransferase
MKIALMDYGVGNIHSLRKALERGGATVTVTSTGEDALATDGLVLPGVGSFGAASQSLRGSGERIRSALEEGLPCLGICLGMQLLFQESEEGDGPGIGLIPGTVRKLTTPVVPHMGWNEVEVAPDRERRSSGGGPAADPLFSDTDRLVAYFANSFVCHPEDEGAVIAWSEYQGYRFAAAVRREQCWGVQFHPEKSSAQGLRILENFLEQIP